MVRAKQGGSLVDRARRRMFVAAALIATLSGCVVGKPSEAPRASAHLESGSLLRPWLSVGAVRIAPATIGMGNPMPHSPVQFSHLVHPASATILGNDVFILDAGLNGLFRYDIGQDVLIRIAALPAGPGAKIRALSDHTLLVLDSVGRRILRVARSGQVMQAYSDPVNLTSPVAFAVDESRQLLFVAGAAPTRLVAFRLGSGASYPVVPLENERDRVHAISDLAMGDRVLHVVDPVKRQIAVMTLDGRIVRVYGHGDLVRPQHIAVDMHGRSWVVDQGQSALKLFVEGQAVRSIELPGQGAASAADIAISGSVLTIADPGARRVHLMRLSAHDASSK